jgi:hypothetical protein
MPEVFYREFFELEINHRQRHLLLNAVCCKIENLLHYPHQDISFAESYDEWMGLVTLLATVTANRKPPHKAWHDLADCGHDATDAP